MSFKSLVIACMALSFAGAALAAGAVPPAISAAVADATRPAADKARDADRKPAELIAFAGIKPGDKVGDIVPGGGYFTRIFAKTVGTAGKVYAIVPQELVKARAAAADPVKQIAAEPGYGNVNVVVAPLDNFKVPEALDVAWTSLNYHDMHTPLIGPTNMGAYNKAVFNALKPGGIYIVIDHAATLGAGNSVAEDLHRIDPQSVEAEVTGIGFVLVEKSDLLAHPADAHNTRVFDSGVRGKTDQFVMKFRKP